MKEYTENQIRDYVCGWLMVGGNQDIAAVKAALRNALAMLEDREDGIEAYVERRNTASVESDHPTIPLEANNYILECLEEGSKVFLFEPCYTERAFFVEHNDRDITICSWDEIGEIQYLNIDNNVRNQLAKDLEVK